MWEMVLMYLKLEHRRKTIITREHLEGDQQHQVKAILITICQVLVMPCRIPEVPINSPGANEGVCVLASQHLSGVYTQPLGTIQPP
jgi:hypothetical protein